MGQAVELVREKINYSLWWIYGSLLSLWTGFLLSIKYVWTDVKRSKKNALIGVFTIVLVLTCVCLLQNAIEKSPMIFMKIAENEVGEFDLILTPKASDSTDVPEGSDDPYSLLDYTDTYYESTSTTTSSIILGVNQTDIQQRIGFYYYFHLFLSCVLKYFRVKKKMKVQF